MVLRQTKLLTVPVSTLLRSISIAIVPLERSGALAQHIVFMQRQ